MANKKTIKTDKFKFPMFCDYTCRQAAFGEPSALGACRRELGVWCKYFKRYNNKNNKCLGYK